MPTPNRREFVKSAGLAITASSVLPLSFGTPPPKTMPTNKSPLCSNQYPWDTFYRRKDDSFNKNLNRSLDELAASGAESLEPNIESIEDIDTLSSKLKERGLLMRSLYVNSVMHEPDLAKSSIETVIRIATHAQKLCQTKIVVTNPSPIRWGGPENKTNPQIATQAQALEQLGKALAQEGLTLAYHNHDPELRLGARELHHCLASTNPEYVKYCLDSHWVYRGCGNSNLALFDIVALYGDRVVELHLRQSSNGIWNEDFTPEGDINYPRLVQALQEKGVSPLIVSEQAVENGSPNKRSALEAHKLSHTSIRKTFAPFLI